MVGGRRVEVDLSLVPEDQQCTEIFVSMQATQVGRRRRSVSPDDLVYKCSEIEDEGREK